MTSGDLFFTQYPVAKIHPLCGMLLYFIFKLLCCLTMKGPDVMTVLEKHAYVLALPYPIVPTILA